MDFMTVEKEMDFSIETSRYSSFSFQSPFSV